MESAQERLDREWLQINDDRRTRGFDLRSLERRSRDFVPNTYVNTPGPVDPEPEQPEEPTITPNSFTANFKERF